MNKFAYIIKMAGLKAIGLLASIGVVIIFIVVSIPGRPMKYENTNVDFITKSGNVTVYAEVSKNMTERAVGLMYRESLDENSGMLFIFRRPRVLNFWMKNTLIPLDMIFISEGFEIIKIQRDVQPCKTLDCPTYGSEGIAKYVVEVNGGFADKKNIKEGDKVKINIV